jgi:hypothetical protein
MNRKEGFPFVQESLFSISAEMCRRYSRQPSSK